MFSLKVNDGTDTRGAKKTKILMNSKITFFSFYSQCQNDLPKEMWRELWPSLIFKQYLSKQIVNFKFPRRKRGNSAINQMTRYIKGSSTAFGWTTFKGNDEWANTDSFFLCIATNRKSSIKMLYSLECSLM